MTPRSRAHDPGLFLNRELSWLAFNERVLAEAASPDVPLLERVKFAAIGASNLDEFFMVRVAGLKRAVEDEDTTPDLAGRTSAQQLADVAARAQAFVAALSRLAAGDLLPALTSHGIRLLSWRDLDAVRRTALGTYFAESVLPVLTPLAIDVSRPFPLLSSLSLNVALLLDPAAGESDRRLAIVQVPPRLTRLVRLVETDGYAFVLLEDIVRAHLSQLFPGQAIVESAVIRLARDAELELDDEGGRTHLELVERQVRERRRSDVIRLEVEASASADLVELLRNQVGIEPADVYVQPGPLDLRVLMGLTDLPGFDALRDPPHQPVDMLAGEQADLFSVMDERDVLLHHPYDCYDPVPALLAQAAEDPDVLAIKQTLYRAGAGSSIIRSLQRAAEGNKQVTVLVEVTARFDEERNIQWARSLEEAGAHVIYGVRGYKTHAKICLIVRRSKQGLRRYVHLGTGNYNEQSAKIYTDFGLLTTSPALAEDASAFFNAVTGYSDPPKFKKLTMAPTDLRRRFLKLIDRERRKAEAGLPTEIVAKMNSLIDAEIIEALYAASKSGVRVLLNVRGICALRPQLAHVSERIDVVSIVDRFLEHSRVYYFMNGGEDEVYLASADWMTRNLDKRIELMWPIENQLLKARVIAALRAMFRDNTKAWSLNADGSYQRRSASAGEPPFRVQEFFQQDSMRAASVARDAAGITLVPEERHKRSL